MTSEPVVLQWVPRRASRPVGAFWKKSCSPANLGLLQPGKGGGRHLICTPALESPWHQFPCYYSLGKAKSGQLYRKLMDNFCLQNFKGRPG